MSVSSPFMQDRFEHERKHLYHLPHPLFDQLEHPKPSYLVGSRGTGKTTLLMALNWQERLRNKGLKEQLAPDPFATHFLGVYLKLPEYKLGAFEGWLGQESEDRYGLVVGVYLDLLMLEVLIDGVAGLINAGVVRVTPTQECQCVDFLMTETDVRNISLSSGTIRPSTLRQLRAFLAQQRETLERHANGRVSLDGVLSTIPSSQMGNLGRSVASRLAGLCDGDSVDADRQWFFKPCLDEGETLTPRQQVVLNTTIRLSSWPLFPIAAFVREPLELTRTLAPGLTLAQADRDLIPLDDSDEKDFRSLCEGVATVRLRTALKSPDTKFEVRTLLGDLDINGLLESTLSQSVNKGGRELLQRAREIALKPFFQDTESAEGTRQTGKHASPPIYQTYLIERLKLSLPEPGGFAWERRAQDSAELRKKMVAAYLSVCREFKLDVRYSSADMVFQMSDKRIRDFLSFIHEIHEESGVSAGELSTATVTPEKQHVAISRASKSKQANIKASGVAAPTPTSRLIEALGAITRVVQTEGPGNRHLMATERGLFRVEISEVERGKYQDILSVIREAADAGYLHFSKADGRTWKFRVHTSLAAAFEFSYRGAYYETPISLRELTTICETADPDERTKIVKALGTRLSGDDSATPSLFAE